MKHRITAALLTGCLLLCGCQSGGSSGPAESSGGTSSAAETTAPAASHSTEESKTEQAEKEKPAADKSEKAESSAGKPEKAEQSAIGAADSAADDISGQGDIVIGDAPADSDNQQQSQPEAADPEQSGSEKADSAPADNNVLPDDGLNWSPLEPVS